MAVVNLKLTFGHLLGREHVLVELGLESRGTLRAASPSLEAGCLGDLLIRFQTDCLLTDGEHLLVLHVLFLVFAFEDGLAVVLDLSLGVISVAFVLEVEAGRNPIRQVGRELNLVVARLELTWQCAHHILVVQELLRLLHLFMLLDRAVNCVALIVCLTSGLLLVPVADELVLAATFDLKLDTLSACDGLGHTEVDAAGDGFTWLIEWLSSAQLDVAVVVLAAVSSEKFHGLIQIRFKFYLCLYSAPKSYE